MQDIKELIDDMGRLKNANIIMQQREMDEIAKENFLDEFKDYGSEIKIGFCVLGGVFSEGIDLKNECLIGSLIIGTGLPMINSEGEILKNYFDEHNKNGFDYAYRYPGMNKVEQAAGRVIRTSEDYGVIILMDDRFLNWDYKGLFPREWSDYKVIDCESVGEDVKHFWRYV
jgi:Rad3-related DNA helicase